MAASHMGHPLAVNRLLSGKANANQQAKVSNLVTISVMPRLFTTSFVKKVYITWEVSPIQPGCPYQEVIKKTLYKFSYAIKAPSISTNHILIDFICSFPYRKGCNYFQILLHSYCVSNCTLIHQIRSAHVSNLTNHVIAMIIPRDSP